MQNLGKDCFKQSSNVHEIKSSIVPVAWLPVSIASFILFGFLRREETALQFGTHWLLARQCPLGFWQQTLRGHPPRINLGFCNLRKSGFDAFSWQVTKYWTQRIEDKIEQSHFNLKNETENEESPDILLIFGLSPAQAILPAKAWLKSHYRRDICGTFRRLLLKDIGRKTKSINDMNQGHSLLPCLGRWSALLQSQTAQEPHWSFGASHPCSFLSIRSLLFPVLTFLLMSRTSIRLLKVVPGVQPIELCRAAWESWTELHLRSAFFFFLGFPGCTSWWSSAPKWKCKFRSWLLIPEFGFARVNLSPWLAKCWAFDCRFINLIHLSKRW